MKTLVVIAVLLLSSCYPLRVARFVDESQSTAKAWICVPDDDPTNAAGIECADMSKFDVQKTPTKVKVAPIVREM